MLVEEVPLKTCAWCGAPFTWPYSESSYPFKELVGVEYVNGQPRPKYRLVFLCKKCSSQTEKGVKGLV